MNKIYRVSGTVTVSGYTIVAASSPEEALEYARERWADTGPTDNYLLTSPSQEFAVSDEEGAVVYDLRTEEGSPADVAEYEEWHEDQYGDEDKDEDGVGGAA